MLGKCHPPSPPQKQRFLGQRHKQWVGGGGGGGGLGGGAIHFFT